MLIRRPGNGNAADDSLRSWTANAEAWDRLMGDGNSFHNELVVRTQLDLIGDGPYDLAVELACGNGNFLAHLSPRARRVIAVDGSAEMLGCAKQRAAGLANCAFVEADLTGATARDLADRNSVDLVVCTMALMDISCLDGLVVAVRDLLRQGGIFVATVAHPAFFGPSPRTEKQITFRNVRGRMTAVPALTVNSYKRDEVVWGRADPDLPQPQPYYARSLESLLAPFFSNGFVVTGLQEPAFSDSETPRRPAKRMDEWRVYTDIPPVLGLRFSLGNSR